MVCLLIGGGIVYWFLFGSSPTRREVAVDPNQPVRLGGRRMPTPRVNKTGANDWTVRGDAGILRVTQTGNDYQFNFGYLGGLLALNQQQVGLISGRYRIIQDPAMAKSWNVTPEQLDKLKKLDVGAGGGLRPSNEDREAIRTLWGEFQAASDKGASQ